ncbi:FliG C-terminal domain-containing protein [Planctomyces sp. SH-PL62]|uniref:FliG C-terminal domain-containing protein n=1 Tax=Planctomyces sp. SH-PL62 TaxID=1636152 RepID=UPI00078BC757|nr:FliG C-terminal domain-containing protein [Planctomyces sp. SH-PL62]AMV40336.1 Flagellar motor switch protein FliG [Planctomyces sp. SH-PL62]
MNASTSSTSARAAHRPQSGAEFPRGDLGAGADPLAAEDSPSDAPSVAAIPPLRKAAIVLVSLEQSLSTQMLAHLDRDAVDAVTWEIARMDRVDPAEQAVVLEEFLSLGLRRLCFVFEDLLRMDDREIRAAFRAEDAEAWALALAGSAPPLRAKVLGALNASAGQMLQRYLENLGPFRLSDTEVAQVEVSERIRILYDQGVIDLPDPSGREEVLV